MDSTLLHVSSSLLAIVEAAFTACVSSSQALTLNYTVKVAVVMYEDCSGEVNVTRLEPERSRRTTMEIYSINVSKFVPFD